MAIDRLSSGHMQQSQEFANRVDARSFQQQQHSQDQTLSAIRDVGHTPERAMQMAQMRQQMQGNALRMATEKMRQQEYYQRLQAYSSEAGLREQLARVKALELGNDVNAWNFTKSQKEWERSNRDPYKNLGLGLNVPVVARSGKLVKLVPVLGGGRDFKELTPEEVKDYRARQKAGLEGMQADIGLKKAHAAYYKGGGRYGLRNGQNISITMLGRVVGTENNGKGMVIFDTRDHRLKIRKATPEEIRNAKKGPKVEEIKAAIKATEDMRMEYELGSEEDLRLEDQAHRLRAMLPRAVLRKERMMSGGKADNSSGGKKITFGRPAKGYEALRAKLKAAGKDEKAIERYIRERSKQK